MTMQIPQQAFVEGLRNFINLRLYTAKSATMIVVGLDDRRILVRYTAG
jgi:hypothetical protein